MKGYTAVQMAEFMLDGDCPDELEAFLGEIGRNVLKVPPVFKRGDKRLSSELLGFLVVANAIFTYQVRCEMKDALSDIRDRLGNLIKFAEVVASKVEQMDTKIENQADTMKAADDALNDKIENRVDQFDDLDGDLEKLRSQVAELEARTSVS